MNWKRLSCADPEQPLPWQDLSGQGHDTCGGHLASVITPKATATIITVRRSFISVAAQVSDVASARTVIIDSQVDVVQGTVLVLCLKWVGQFRQICLREFVGEASKAGYDVLYSSGYLLTR
jgi:hypothetical protein